MWVRDCYLWVEDGRWCVRVGTNAPKSLILQKLEELGVGQMVVAAEQFDDLLRLGGGNCVILRFDDRATREALLEALVQL
jgi:hypothetical protein